MILVDPPAMGAPGPRGISPVGGTPAAGKRRFPPPAGVVGFSGARQLLDPNRVLRGEIEGLGFKRGLLVSIGGAFRGLIGGRWGELDPVF